MNIGAAAKRSGVSARMIRHYESLGLLGRVVRTPAGYRTYGPDDVHLLRFIARARDLGFPILQIAQLVALWKDRRRTSRTVKNLALQHIAHLEQKGRELLEVKAALQRLVDGCEGDERPHCPIIEELAAQEPANPRSRRSLQPVARGR